MNTRIKELRNQRGIRQEILAKHIGSTQQTISRIENGKCIPPLDLVMNISKYFNVTVDYILYLSDTRRSIETQLQMNYEVDEFHDVVSIYKGLSKENKDTVALLLKRLRELQEEGDKSAKDSNL